VRPAKKDHRSHGGDYRAELRLSISHIECSISMRLYNEIVKDGGMTDIIYISLILVSLLS